MTRHSPENPDKPDLEVSNERRRFLRSLVVLGVGARSLLRPGRAAAAREPAGGAVDTSLWPDIPRRRLGRTGFMGSRLVFGCGAALGERRKDELLEAAFAAGINVFDSGCRRYYGDTEINLAPFLQRRRDEIFLISKAMTYLEVDPDEEITPAQAREGAQTWTGLLEHSLRELQVEYVDAYYLMAADNPHIVRSEELRSAFQRAKKAGKVRHFGLSTHRNIESVLEAAMETGDYDLAQVAITPAGWYDFTGLSGKILPGSPPMRELRGFLDRVRASGIGLIGMKAARYLAGRRFLGWAKPDAFDAHYDEALRTSDLSPFQRSYAFVLGNGLDAVNADMQELAHLEQNVAATAESDRFFS